MQIASQHDIAKRFCIPAGSNTILCYENGDRGKQLKRNMFMFMFINQGHKMVWTWSCNTVQFFRTPPMFLRSQWTSTELHRVTTQKTCHCKNLKSNKVLTFIMQDQEDQELSLTSAMSVMAIANNVSVMPKKVFLIIWSTCSWTSTAV
jgi:hypothetical protein